MSRNECFTISEIDHLFFQKLTSLAISLEALAALIGIASALRSYPFFLDSSNESLYIFCEKKEEKHPLKKQNTAHSLKQKSINFTW